MISWVAVGSWKAGSHWAMGGTPLNMWRRLAALIAVCQAHVGLMKTYLRQSLGFTATLIALELLLCNLSNGRTALRIQTCHQTTLE